MPRRTSQICLDVRLDASTYVPAPSTYVSNNRSLNSRFRRSACSWMPNGGFENVLKSIVYNMHFLIWGKLCLIAKAAGHEQMTRNGNLCVCACIFTKRRYVNSFRRHSFHNLGTQDSQMNCSSLRCRNSNLVHVFFIRKSLFCLSLNFLNFSRNWASDFLKFFLTFTEINWPEWFRLSLIILYTWIWIPSLTFWMQ